MAHSDNCKACKKIKTSLIKSIIEEENNKKKEILESPEFIEKHKQIDEMAELDKIVKDEVAFKKVIQKSKEFPDKTMGELLQEAIDKKKKEEFEAIIKKSPESICIPPGEHSIDEVKVIPSHSTMGERLKEEIEKIKAEDQKLKEKEFLENFTTEVRKLKKEVKKIKAEEEVIKKKEELYYEDMMKKGIESPKANPDPKTNPEGEINITFPPKDNSPYDLSKMEKEILDSVAKVLSEEYNKVIGMTENLSLNIPKVDEALNKENEKPYLTKRDLELLKTINQNDGYIVMPEIIFNDGYITLPDTSNIETVSLLNNTSLLNTSEIISKQQDELVSLKDEINKLKEEFKKYEKIEKAEFIKYGEKKDNYIIIENEVIIIPATENRTFINGQWVTTSDLKAELKYANIIPNSFVSSIPVELIPRSGIITILSGTPLNLCGLFGTSVGAHSEILDSIRIVVSYTYIPGDNSAIEKPSQVTEAPPLRKFVIRFEASSKKILLLSADQATLEWNNKNGNMMNTILHTTVEPYLKKLVTTELLKEFADNLYDKLNKEFPEEIFQLRYIPV